MNPSVVTPMLPYTKDELMKLVTNTVRLTSKYLDFINDFSKLENNGTTDNVVIYKGLNISFSELDYENNGEELAQWVIKVEPNIEYGISIEFKGYGKTSQYSLVNEENGISIYTGKLENVYKFMSENGISLDEDGYYIESKEVDALKQWIGNEFSEYKLNFIVE